MSTATNSMGCFTSRRRRTPSCAACAFPNGIVDAHRFARGGGDLAEALRRGLRPRHHTREPAVPRDRSAERPASILERLAEAGLTSRGAGADNIRNITGNPTAGIRPSRRSYDTRPLGPRAVPHDPESSGAVRPAAQVQHRLRRRWRVGFAGGHQRHRLFRGPRGSRQTRSRRRALPGRCRGHHWPRRFHHRSRRGDRAAQCVAWRSRSCACSSTKAIAPTASAPASNTCSHAWDSTRSWRAVESRFGATLPRLAAADCEPRQPRGAGPHRLPSATQAGNASTAGVALRAGRMPQRRCARWRRSPTRHGSGRVAPHRMAEPHHLRHRRCRCGCGGKRWARSA